MTSAAEDVQTRIDGLQKELHAAIAASDFAFDEKRNAILSERDAAVADMIASKELPENFWGSAVVSFLTLRHKESESVAHFLGPYDAELLQTYLTNVAVKFTPKGFRLTMRFKENPFFVETELYAGVRGVSVKEEGDKGEADHEESKDEVEDEALEFSGITWKAGHGPTDPEESDDDDEGGDSDAEDGKGEGRKRSRSDSGAGEEERRSATQGPSMLEVFSEMDPHPEDDSELDELDDDELADAVDDWESDAEDRRLLLSLLAEEMMASPHQAIRGLGALESLVDELKQKAAKTE